MDIPLIADGARLPTLALMVSMALASAVAAVDDGVKSRTQIRLAVHAKGLWLRMGLTTATMIPKTTPSRVQQTITAAA
jgi:hypothetical protein